MHWIAVIAAALVTVEPVMAGDADPLEGYYGNTLICAAATTGNDLCHLWLYRNGTFINFDRSGGHAGHYTVSPVHADGKVFVCQTWDTPNMLVPKELQTPVPVPPPTAGMQKPSANVHILCKTENFHTTCQRVDVTTLSDADRLIASRTMGERFHHGMCYPLGPHKPGDVWFETDDPLPSQAGRDKLLLLAGHR